MTPPRQCAVLVGGLGTRLGALTARTPKPLLDCGDRPFLAWVLRELVRFGMRDVLLLTGYRSEIVEALLPGLRKGLPKEVSIRISNEPSPAGTGGALWHARDLLEEEFLLINGDSWIDTNLMRFMASFPAGVIGHMLLRQVEDASRYGVVEFSGNRVTAFHERRTAPSAGIINGGIYVFRRKMLDYIEPICSLEGLVMPKLASEGLLSGVLMDGFFIDIGIPEDYERAQREIPARLKRPAIFFAGETLWSEEEQGLRLRPGAEESVRLANESGWHVFVVADENALLSARFADAVDALRQAGGNVDDTVSGADVPELARNWEIDLSRSFGIGTGEQLAGLPVHECGGRNVHALVKTQLEDELPGSIPEIRRS